MKQNGRFENFVRSLGPWRLNQTIVGTNRRHVLRTFNGMSHEITYTGPFSIYFSSTCYTNIQKKSLQLNALSALPHFPSVVRCTTVIIYRYFSPKTKTYRGYYIHIFSSTEFAYEKYILNRTGNHFKKGSTLLHITHYKGQITDGPHYNKCWNLEYLQDNSKALAGRCLEEWVATLQNCK